MELLERTHFQDMLDTGFERTQSGEGHVFLIGGEAGIGKSSLARNFLQEVEDRCNIYTSLCDSMFSPRPLAPVYDLAMQLDPSIVASGQSGDSRMLLFARVVQAFAQQKGVTVVLIEDIHWADEATLDFIKYFGRRIGQTKCLLLLTYRDNEITSSHPLRNVLGELVPGTFTRMQLPPLSTSTVTDLASKKGYNGKDLYQLTGGNPFYVTEILASYSPGIPENIRDSILSIYHKGNEATRNAWQLLGIIPEGLDQEWIATMDKHFPEAVESCMNHGIIVMRQNRIHFKHELYRRTMEASLSPFKRRELNKKIIELFLPFFEERGQVERIVHYAMNAGEKELVSKYAPLAAKQAAELGAHTEAARLYLVAIEYQAEQDKEQLLQLYEAYTYECYLINQIDEGIIYQKKALKLQEEKGDQLGAGNSLRFLSRLSWFTGRTKEAEEYAARAIAIFEGQEASIPKAKAWSNMSQLKMLADETAAAIKWGTEAMEMAKAVGDDETYSHALNNVGSTEYRITNEEAGRMKLEQSLAIAQQHGYHEHVARAYTNLISCSINNRHYDKASEYLDNALGYCEERDLHSWKSYILSWKARMLMETGHWAGALAIIGILEQYADQPAIVRVTVGFVKSTIGMRTGKSEVEQWLKEAKRLAFETGEHQRIIPVAMAAMEYEWLRGQPVLNDSEIAKVISLVENTDNRYPNLAVAYWMHKARPEDASIQSLYNRFYKFKKTDQKAALAFKRWSECPYEKAILLSEGKEDDKREALSMLQELKADVVVEKIKSEMRSSGIKSIPRGIRASTQSNPAQLTTRELDILRLLKTGAADKQIAASLFISPKTVGHHISSILFKLDVTSRTKAVTEAETLGILK